MDTQAPPAFLYDFNSPYAYLAAARVDEVLPVRPRWQPVAFAFMLRAHRREPWSFDEHERELGIAECERRAKLYGLPTMRWPPGWPVQSYGLISLRAAIVADDHGLLREFSRAAFARNFVEGLGLKHLDDVGAVADRVGLDPRALRHEVVSQEVKDRLAAATEAAIAAGAVGVPTVCAVGQVFWGDDQLDTAAAAILSSSQS
jgi:2-hydroxychromene-2-carboxylate isomerase